MIFSGLTMVVPVRRTATDRITTTSHYLLFRSIILLRARNHPIAMSSVKPANTFLPRQPSSEFTSANDTLGFLWPVGGRGRERQALVTHKINKLVNYASSCNQAEAGDVGVISIGGARTFARHNPFGVVAAFKVVN